MKLDYAGLFNALQPEGHLVLGALLVLGFDMLWARHRPANRHHVALAIGLRFMRVNVANSGQIEKTLLGLHGLTFLSVGLYVWQSDLWAKVAGQTLETDWPKLVQPS